MAQRGTYAVMPGSRLEAALKKTVRRERRHLLAVMAQRMPATKFEHMMDADTREIVTTVTARRTEPTRRQRKWHTRLAHSLNARGVQL